MKSFSIACFCFIFFGGFGILCAVWAVVTLRRGEYLTAITVLGFAAFCFGFVVPFTKLVPGKLTARGAFDVVGTTIRPDRGVDVPIQVSVLGLVLATSLFAMFYPLGMLDIPVPRPMRFSLPFMSAAGAVMGAPALWRMGKRGGTKYLRLTPKGFEFAQGWSSPRGEWAQVQDVTDRAPGQPPRASAVVMVMSDGKTPTLAAGSFTPDGRALRELVRFYWQHPDRRTELTDGRALARLRNEQFEVK